MIKPKEKKCKGTGKAIDNGCGEMALRRKYGLCMKCFAQWLYSTKEGLQVVERQSISSVKNNRLEERKTWNKKKEKLRPLTHSKELKKALGDEIQKLARMIDNLYGFDCIDCERPFMAQQDGGHFKSKGSNASIRWNLHNIHSQRSECNQNGLGGGRERQYYDGLVRRYGEDYAQMVDVGLQKKYKRIGLMNHEIPAKLKIVRAIVRNFETYRFKGSIQARELCNNLIGIYG